MSVEDERHARNCDCERCEQRRAIAREVAKERTALDKKLIAAASGFDPYNVTVRGVRLDPYLIATAFDLPPAVAEALKKLLRLGRKHKTREQDLAEAIKTLQRHQEIEKELGKP